MHATRVLCCCMCAEVDTEVPVSCLFCGTITDRLFSLRSFGIFRLTDPPGLKTILECVATEAFHPHPERPIYTVRDPKQFHKIEPLELTKH